MAQTETEVSDE